MTCQKCGDTKMVSNQSPMPGKRPCDACSSELIKDSLSLTAEEKIKLLTDGLKQMLSHFDTPVARRRMSDQWSEDSRAFARKCFEKATGTNIYDDGKCFDGAEHVWSTPIIGPSGYQHRCNNCLERRAGPGPYYEKKGT